MAAKCRICGGNATAWVNVAPDAASGGSMEPVCSDHIPSRYKTISLDDHNAALAKIASLTAQLARCREAFETREKKDGVTLSTHALYNLEGALIDIERQGKADAVSLRTLKRVASQLAEIDRALAPTTGDGR